MADQSISQLPVAATITGNELAVVVQNGITKQAQVSQLANAISPGKLINYLYFDGASNLIVVYTDSTTQNLGPIPGYIAASINSVGHLILTNSTGGTTDAGSVFASLTQTFTTVNNETATLPNSQRLIAGANISLTSGTNTLTIAASGSAGSLNSAGLGFIVKDTSNTVVARTLTSTAGISITNPTGGAGNPVISPSLKLADIQNLATTGILAVVGGTTVIDRNIVGTASQITVTGGDGSANPTISIAPSPVLPGTGSVTLPTGTTAQRPGALAGQLRFNTSLNVFEGQNNSGVWQTLALGGGVTSVGSGTGLTGGPITSTGTISIANTGVTAGSYTNANITVNAQGQITVASSGSAGGVTTFSAGTTGFTPSAASTGAITLAGTLNVANGGTGATTLTGYLVGNGTSAVTAVATIPNAGLTNSSVTYNGTTVALGASGTITAVNPNALTIGTGLTGTSYTGAAAVTIAIDSTVATLTGTQTLTNKTISGASNTLTNIANASLTNSSITLGTSAVSLGGTLLAPAGLTSVTVTADPTLALQLATKQYVDGLVSTGLAYHQPVQAATTAALTGVVVYNNGAAGVGATLTLTTPLTVLDGYTLLNTNRILIKNQVDQAQNGIYTWATGGTVLTRATDADTYGPGTSQLSQNDYFFTQNGTVNKGTSFVVTTVGTITFGTTAITFAEFSSSLVYTGGTGITVAGTVISLSDTAVTTGTYGNAARTTTQTVNQQGQITNIFDQLIAIAGSQITSGTVAIANGGTGQTTASAAFNALSPITTTGDVIIGNGTNSATRLGIGSNGQVLTSNGTTATWTTPASGGVTTISFGSTGLTPATATSGAVTVAGTLAVANGGTGRTVGNYSIYANEIHVGKDGNDTTGDGTLINPVLTITKALTLIAAGRNTVIVHPGSYSESPTVTSTNTTIATSELTGANTQIAGTLTLSAAARVSGIKLTNLTITGSGSTYISNCTVDTRVIKSGTNYVEIINTELQCVSGVQITGAGTVSILGNKCWAVAVSNASANVLIKDCFQVITPSVTAGTLQIDGSAIFAASPASNAVTSSVGSFITLANSFVLNSAGTNVERVSLAGFYSILNLVYDKTNSTFTGTNLNAIDYFSVINTESLVSSGTITATNYVGISGGTF